MNTVMKKQDSVVLVPTRALEKAREVLRAVAAGEPVDNAGSAALAAYALAALPPAARAQQYVA